jgi:hypothetical protein
MEEQHMSPEEPAETCRHVERRIDAPGGPSRDDVGAVPAPALDGVCSELGALPPGALVTEKALAVMLAKCVKSIKRAVARGELPAPVRIMGAPTWTAGAIVRHVEKRLDAAAREAERERARLGQLRA